MRVHPLLAVSLALVVVASARADGFAECGRRNSDSHLTNTPRYRGYNHSVGVIPAERNEFPWQVSIKSVRNGLICGGSIINDRWIVTAANCVVKGVWRLHDFRIVAGAHDLRKEERTTQERGVDRIIGHPEFEEHPNGMPVPYDIALIKLDRPLTMSPRSVAPICLPESGDVKVVDKICVTSGWRSVWDVLMKNDIPVFNNGRCANLFRNILGLLYRDNMMCAGNSFTGAAICERSIGGPLACENDGVYTLAGVSITSYQCGSKYYPSIFTPISSFREWIVSVID